MSFFVWLLFVTAILDILSLKRGGKSILSRKLVNNASPIFDLAFSYLMMLALAFTIGSMLPLGLLVLKYYTLEVLAVLITIYTLWVVYCNKEYILAKVRH